MKYSFLYYLCPFIPIRKYRRKIRGKAKSKPFFEAVLASVDSNKWKSFKIIAFHLGEVVTFAMFYKYWWNGEMVIATKKYHLDIFKMLAPEVPIILCEEKIFFKETSEYKKHIFSFVLINDELERWNLTTRNHYFDNWQNYLGKNLKTQNYATPVISEGTTLSAIKKLGKMGLPLENLIFVAPEAQSLSPLPETFWSSIIDTAQKKKYQIFINKSKGDNILTIEEAYFVASHCKMIIALRSGLIDLLCMINKPLRIIYTIGPSDLPDIQPIYALKEFPFCSKDVVEYNIHTDSVENINKQIINEIETL